MITLFAPDDAATAAIGAALAEALLPGDVVALAGDLGTGKTALARAIIRARLGDADHEVPSPTFAIVQPYPGIIHADLYRLSAESEVDELGLLDDEAILLVEWPDRAPDLVRRPGLTVELEMGWEGEGRLITVTSRGNRDIEPFAAMLAPWRQPRAH